MGGVTFSLTLPQHPHSQTLHEAAGLAGLAPPLGDLTLVGGWTAVLDVPCDTETCWEKTQKCLILEAYLKKDSF